MSAESIKPHELRRTRLSMQRRWGAALVLAALTLGSLTTASPAWSDEAADFALAKEYAETFYPRWLTNAQMQVLNPNRLIGPDRISPIYQAVVAINDDTLYASGPIDTSGGPVIISVPETTVSYSVLNLDFFGNVYDFGIPSQPNGTVYPATTYALTPPGYAGPIPPGATEVEMALELMFLIFRSDKYRPDGTNVETESEAFRTGLVIDGTPTTIRPEVEFGLPFKTVADDLMRFAPIQFLTELQTAVHAPGTPPLTPEEQALSDTFDAAFPPAGSDQGFADGTRAAHQAIVDNYLDAAGPTGWNHFTNIGAWGDAVLDRASLNMFIQYGNSIETAAYYHAFIDGNGNALTGATADGYVLKLSADQIPPAERFWSLTAYTPEAIELIPNAIDKYEVASYTPGLVMDPDGGVTIYISRVQPAGVPQANWLPVGTEDFNVMLRVYGVINGSNVANNTYVPPAIVPYVPPAPPPVPAAPIAVTPRFTG